MRRKLAIAAMALYSSAVTPSLEAQNLTDIRFAKYKVIAQGPGMAGQGKLTYVVSVNPPFGAMIQSAGPALMQRISTGVLRNCQLFDEDERQTLEKAALVLNQRFAEADLMQALSGSAGGASYQDQLQGAKNFIAYINATMDRPRYECEISPQSAQTQK
jgi:hypothetical protein